MTIDAIYLDLDGVLGDFVTAAIEAHGKVPADVYAAWPRGEYDIANVLGAKDDEFWRPIDEMKDYGGRKGHWFWEQKIQPYPWRDLLWNLCEERAETWVLTSPSRHPGSSYGKVAWLQAWKGEKFRQYALAPRKAHLARPGALLIDDDHHNTERWAKNGGETILFPRLWNSRHERADRPIETIITELITWCGK